MIINEDQCLNFANNCITNSVFPRESKHGQWIKNERVEPQNKVLILLKQTQICRFGLNQSVLMNCFFGLYKTSWARYWNGPFVPVSGKV